MQHAKVRMCALLVTCALVAVAAEQPGEARRFPIPGHGSIVLDVPQGWRVASKPLEAPASVVIQMGPASGEAFSIQVSSVFVDPAQDRDLTPASLKERMQKSADESLPRSVEKKATLVELRGKQAAGYYYSLTDQESTSAPGDYKYMTQGSVLTGRVLTIFTILQHDASGKEKELALRMLADAADSPAETKEPGQQDPTRLRIDETGRAYRLSVPVGKLVLTFPKAGFKRATTQVGGATASPRYFYFTDEGRKLQLSGWFENATCTSRRRPDRAIRSPRSSRRSTSAKSKEWDSIMDLHGLAEERSLAYHREVAARLRRRPELIALATRRAQEWAAKGGRLEWRRWSAPMRADRKWPARYCGRLP